MISKASSQTGKFTQVFFLKAGTVFGGWSYAKMKHNDISLLILFRNWFLSDSAVKINFLHPYCVPTVDSQPCIHKKVSAY